ncbi:MAG: PepSY-associated TM helix domain-containing protein [Muribaculaceae bacterium]|nr:PepSY-associated TM helix domain-containing protein [Muribaculaceae bacterium]
MANTDRNNNRSGSAVARRLCVALHRDLGFFFAGIIVIYALSGIFMNHRRDINPSYTVEVTEMTLPSGFPTRKDAIKDTDISALLDAVGESGNLTKHYFVKDNLKILLKGGSSLNFNMGTRTGTYEKVRQRPLISDMVKLHYNPGRWWTAFSDIFAISLILITVTGLFIIKGRKGITGRGAIELIIGLSVPILFLLL